MTEPTPTYEPLGLRNFNATVTVIELRGDQHLVLDQFQSPDLPAVGSRYETVVTTAVPGRAKGDRVSGVVQDTPWDVRDGVAAILLRDVEPPPRPRKSWLSRIFGG